MNAITNNIDVNVLQIKQAIESFAHSEARSDCLGALAQSKDALVRHLDQHLWVHEGYSIIGVFDTEAKAQIAIDLKQSTGWHADYWEIYSFDLNKSEDDNS